jgi:putative ABC transport system ATP-binding protein
VAIARALASNPGLLLCDEPTGAVDIETGQQVLKLLADLNDTLEKTVVLITHNRSIASIGHRVAEIRDGTIRSVTVNEHRKAVEQVQW